jgi:outer membrane protein OmpA-like peptidoglycan-associated protein
MTVPRTSAAAITLLCAGALACANSPPEPAAERTAPREPPPAAAATTADFSLERQARELAAIPGAAVARRSDVLTVRFEGSSLFDAGSAELSEGGQERVRSLARAVVDQPRERIIVRGHTDSQRDERSSQTLSEELADTVRNFLVAEGVLPSRITAVGLAASQPVATNTTEEGRAQNRRIEIELWPEPALTEGGAPQ